MQDDDLLSLSLDLDMADDAVDEKPKKTGTRMRCHSQLGKKRFDTRRFTSEQTLLETCPWHFLPGDVYHVISAGDCDALTFVRHAMRQQRADYLLISSWCFGLEDVREIRSWVDLGLVSRLDCYMGEIAAASYANCQRELEQAAEKTGGRLGVFRNHSKVAVILGERFDCAICSSANINTNPRTENTVITCDTAVAEFYKDFFDGIHPFNMRKAAWEPYKRHQHTKQNGG